MSDAPADLTAALVQLMKQNATITALLDDWVFGGELPPGATAQMPKRALVIALSGGVSLTSGSNAEHDTQRVDVFGYGETPHEAARVIATAGLVMRRIERVVSEGVLIHWARQAGGFSAGRDGQTQWPRAFQSFQVFHSLTEV